MKGLAKTFDARIGALSEVDSQAMASILTAASDIALVLDEAGVIRDITLGQVDHPIEESKAWLGHGWVDTVTPESRTKILEMLKEAAADGVSRRRQVNHLSATGNDIPIAYTAVRLGRGENQLVAIGRDLRAVSALQQRLVEAQQSLERDYWRMRHIETRYRLLFQVATEAVLMVDATTQKVVEANPAAAQLFDQPAKKLVGRSFPFEFDREGESLVSEQLATARAQGRAEDVVVRLGGSRRATVSVSLVRQDTTSLFLVRLLGQGEEGKTGNVAPIGGGALRLVESMPDGFVVADTDGRLVSANRAFLDMIEMPTVEQVRGQPLARWIGRPGADMGLLLATLREHGVVRLFGTSLRGDLGSASEVEVSCAAVPDGSPGQLGFLVRDVGRRLALGPRGARDLTRAVEQLTALVGRVSLKNLVRDTTDLVERHFIEAALETTEDNRTSAAEVLGVSRQSLYVKLRRYNLGGIESPDDASISRPAKLGARKKAKKH
jgi:transcriptional regulator PpsR